jgi:hypothetical protein
MQLPLQSLKTLTLKQRHRHVLTEQQVPEVQPSLQTTISLQEQDVCLLEEKIFSVIMNYNGKNNKLLKIDQDLLPYFSPKIQALLQTYEAVKQQNIENPWNTFLDRLDEQTRTWVIRVSLKYGDVACHESFEQLVTHFCKLNWKNIVKQIKEEIKAARAANNVEHLNEILATFLKLKQGIQSRGLI